MENKKTTIIHHLAEFRKRLIIILVANIVMSLICYQYIEPIMQLILDINPGMKLVFISPSELFLVYVKISLIFGVVMASPITFINTWIFIAKGLFKKEKIYIIISLVLGIIFFALGVIFCYIAVLPTTLAFFHRITISGVSAMISIAAYTSFISTMLLAFGIVFEMPIVILLLSLIGIVKAEFLKKQRPIIIIIIFIMAALITPPDVISQMFLAIPMVILFEISIAIAIFIEFSKKRKKVDE